MSLCGGKVADLTLCGRMSDLAAQTAWIGVITIDCDDAEAMRRFYREALGGVDMPGYSQSVRVAGIPVNFRELERLGAADLAGW